MNANHKCLVTKVLLRKVHLGDDGGVQVAERVAALLHEPHRLPDEHVRVGALRTRLATPVQSDETADVKNLVGLASHLRRAELASGCQGAPAAAVPVGCDAALPAAASALRSGSWRQHTLAATANLKDKASKADKCAPPSTWGHCRGRSARCQAGPERPAARP